MQNSSCPKWRALEWFRRNTAALRTDSVPDQESQLTMPMSSKAPLDSLILPLDFSDSQQVTDNVSYRFLAQLWGTSMQGKLRVPHTRDFPFFFPSTQHLLHWQSAEEAQGKERKKKVVRAWKRSGGPASNDKFQKQGTFKFPTKIARQKITIVTIPRRTSAKIQQWWCSCANSMLGVCKDTYAHGGKLFSKYSTSLINSDQCQYLFY